MPEKTFTTSPTQPDQTRMPFAESLRAERDRWQVSFHMPGHKGTLAFHPLLEDLFGGNPLPADLVEISGVIDYLHAPKGTIKEAQELAAAAYGADHTFFLINGSTVGNEGAVMSISGPGQKVIMARASHRSVYGGLVLSGATPVYIAPEYHPQVGFPLAVRVEAVRALLAAHEHVAAVHITSPNYYGVLSDTAAIAQAAHEYGAAMLVDEAHGSHLNFHEALPESATRLGADMIIQSTHKTQGALTQGSMLHVNEGRVNRARVAQVLATLQTSSPSSLLVASLDVARMEMATQGHEWLGRIIPLAQAAREAIRQIPGLWCYGDDLVGTGGIYAYDPTKLIIRVADTGTTGFDTAQQLRHAHGIDVEFADLRQVICSVTIGDSESSINRLIEALRAIAGGATGHAGNITADEIQPPAMPQQAISPREAYFAASRVVKLDEAVGQIVAENIIPYPPGIPLLVPGEVLGQEHLDYLRYIMRRGSGVVGTEDRTVQTVRIVE